MGGLRTFIPAANTVIFPRQAGGTELPIIDSAGAGVRRLTREAGDTRVMFVGNAAAMEDGKDLQLRHQRADQLHRAREGAPVSTFRSCCCHKDNILIKTHPLMSRHGMYRKSAFVLDFDAIKWAPLRGRDTETR